MSSNLRRERRLTLFLLTALCLALVAATPAKVGAADSPFLKAIRVNPLTEDGLGPLMVKFKTLKCGLTGPAGNKGFSAVATSATKYKLVVFIDAWSGFKASYDIHYASEDPMVRLFTPDGQIYSNQNSQPGPAWAGKIAFRGGGDKISIGFVPAMNTSATAQVSIIGHAACAWRTPRK